jgi:hypothetical protein
VLYVCGLSVDKSQAPMLFNAYQAVGFFKQSGSCVMKSIKRFVANEDGATAIEYALSRR